MRPSIEAFLSNVVISTLAVINGSGFQRGFAPLCDIGLCADHAVLFYPHFRRTDGQDGRFTN